jgi:superfamily II DNA or RNA helicase
MTGPLLPLRSYQTEAISELHRRWDAGATRVPMVLATGLGKTVIFAHLIAKWVRSTVAKRALVLVHTDELVQQAYKKIKDVAPGLHVGIVKAERNDVTARVIVASVQSLRSEKRRNQIRNVGLIIVDECHHATAKTYRTILEHFGAMGMPEDPGPRGMERMYPYPPVKVAGFTATLARGDKAKLSDIWEECTFSRGIPFGIRRGYLLDVRGKRIVVPDLDLSTVKKTGGDYQDAALGSAMDAALAPAVIADAYREHANGGVLRRRCRGGVRSAGAHRDRRLAEDEREQLPAHALPRP